MSSINVSPGLGLLCARLADALSDPIGTETPPDFCFLLGRGRDQIRRWLACLDFLRGETDAAPALGDLAGLCTVLGSVFTDLPDETVRTRMIALEATLDPETTSTLSPEQRLNAAAFFAAVADGLIQETAAARVCNQ